MEPRDAVDLLRALAEQQHGVVARHQLLAAGIRRERIASWRRSGRLVVQRRGVYSLGHGLLTQEARWLAAVLACGEGAVLSHRSAAALWGLRPPGGGAIDVTVGGDGGRRPGEDIRAFRSAIAGARFATTERGIPVTTVAWTLVDLAAVVRPHQLRRAVEEADRLELFDLVAVDRALGAAKGRRGSRALIALLADMAERGVTRTRSDVEAAFLQLCIDQGIPRPEVNRVRDGVEHDFRWPDRRLVVEVDGWAYHRGQSAFAADRQRDRRALTAGWRVARFTASEVLRTPVAVADEVARMLRNR
jgi:very-short-patch-repair endonuclease